MLNICEISENEVYLSQNDELINLGKVHDFFNKNSSENLEKIKLNFNFYLLKKFILTYVTKDFLIDEIKNIDKCIELQNTNLNANLNLNSNTNLNHTKITIDFDNIINTLKKKYQQYTHNNILSKEDLTHCTYDFLTNKFEFITYCFLIHDINIEDVLLKKFRNSVLKNINDKFVICKQ